MTISRLPDALLSGTSREFPIEHLFAEHAEHQLQPGERPLFAFVLPPWQRDEVWDSSRKRRFVEGVFLGLGTGYYVVHATDWDDAGRRPVSSWLLDGQQRLRDLYERLNFGGMPHTEADRARLLAAADTSGGGRPRQR